MKKIDDWLIAKIQATYLWLYDLTGVYIATISVALYGISLFVQYEAMIMQATMFIFVAFFAWPSYSQQANDEIEIYNENARIYRESRIRGFLIFILIIAYMYDISKLDIRGGANTTLVFIWQFLQCVEIRKRKPQEKEAPFQTQGAA